MSPSDPTPRSEPKGSKLVSIIDDDPTVRRLMRFWLEKDGYQIIEHASGTSALNYAGDMPAAVCIDLGLDDVPGLEVLRHLKARDPEISLIVVTAQRDIDTAVEAMRAGAYDYVTKPLERERLLLAVGRGIERRDLVSNVRRLKNALSEHKSEHSIIGRSAPMMELDRQISHVLESDVAVCVFGESGTGKELVARAIHQGGPRKAGPFVAINCAAIPHSLLESELFGHERGAFTGATHTRRGRFEEADRGTLFLDELGEMSSGTQASLLRTLQEKKIRRVGGSQEIPTDARIVCATHRDLRAEVEAGRFREDLYFRLVVYPIIVPPLRNRVEDIPLLVGHFLQSLRADVGREVQRISPEALEALTRYRWPGNVRELQNVVHRCMLASRGHEITLADLPQDVRAHAAPPIPHHHTGNGSISPISIAPTATDIVPLQELERRAIERALRATGGSVGKAAKLLGIGRATLYRRIQSMSLSREVA
ncbi:MAG: sigma-54 dependent transcriptional regulator [Polyangiaceae bacterium]|nr:sigma-54 dependent transcriptional regulator [Polyangiaceae bacterium]